jgi:hypothetical protein
MLILRAAFTYFAIVFGTGFCLGAVRVSWLVPRLGVRTAELLEMPLMAVAMLLAARYLHRRQLHTTGNASLAAVGFLALALMLVAEILLGVVVLHRSLPQLLTDGDPISGSVYLALLILYALLPLLLGRGSTTTAVP